MPDEFETNVFAATEGIHEAGDYALRMMKWLISGRYIQNINHHDLIATALRFMKGERLNTTKEGFAYINE